VQDFFHQHHQKEPHFRTTLTILASQTSSTSVSLRKSGGFTRIFFKPRCLRRKKHNKTVWKMATSKNDDKMRRVQQQMANPLCPRTLGPQICRCSGRIIAKSLSAVRVDSCFQFGINITSSNLFDGLLGLQCVPSCSQYFRSQNIVPYVTDYMNTDQA